MSAINPSVVLRHIKRKVGASHFPLPLTDEEMLDVVYDETMYTFSKYYPHFVELNLEISRDRTDRQKGIYYIEDNDLDIIGVTKIFRGFGYMAGTYIPRNTNPMDMQLATDMRSMIENPDTWRFHPPNKLEVFPKYIDVDDLLVQVKAIHPKHMATIPFGLRDQFLLLAEYDVKVALYEILKNFDTMNTAFGAIDLKLNGMEQAEDKRRELLETWDSKFIFEPNRKRIYVY